MGTWVDFVLFGAVVAESVELATILLTDLVGSMSRIARLAECVLGGRSTRPKRAG